METSNQNDVQEQLDRVGMSVQSLPKPHEILANVAQYAELCTRISEMMEDGGFKHTILFSCHQVQAIDLLTQALKYACNQRDALVDMISKSRGRCEFCAWNEGVQTWDVCPYEYSHACHIGIADYWEMNKSLRKIMLRKDMQPCSTQPILQM